jgi:hypothetical protein
MNRNKIEETGEKRQPDSSVRKPESASKMYDDEKKTIERKTKRPKERRTNRKQKKEEEGDQREREREREKKGKEHGEMEAMERASTREPRKEGKASRTDKMQKLLRAASGEALDVRQPSDPLPSKRAPLSGGPRAAGEDPTTTAIGQD